MKNFNDWNRQKTEIHGNEKPIYFHEREIWFIKLGVNIGYEQDGKGEDFRRPVVVIKKFNKTLFLGVPLTTQEKNGKFYLPITKFNKHNNNAILSQIRLFDSKRLIKKLYKMSKEEHDILKKAIAHLIERNDL